jgi:hypothetical protein
MFLDAKGDLQMGVADFGNITGIKGGLNKVSSDLMFHVCNGSASPQNQVLERLEAAAPKIVAIDGNESSSTISAIIEKAKALGSMSELENGSRGSVS